MAISLTCRFGLGRLRRSSTSSIWSGWRRWAYLASTYGGPRGRRQPHQVVDEHLARPHPGDTPPRRSLSHDHVASITWATCDLRKRHRRREPTVSLFLPPGR